MRLLATVLDRAANALALPFVQVRGFVRDSVSYLQGLFSPWELPQAIFHHRNKMITKVRCIAAPSRLIT